MAQYYDPREAATTFSLFAKVHGTEEEKIKGEKQEKKEDIKGLMTPWKMLEAKRAGDIARATQLLTEGDPRTATRRKFKSKEYISPERKEYDPRRLKDWFQKRYARSGEERVTRETRMRPGTKSFEWDDLTTTLPRPEGNVAHMQRVRNKAYEEQLATQASKQREAQNLETIQKRWGFGKEQPLGGALAFSGPPTVSSIGREELREQQVAKMLEGYEGSLGGGPQGRTEELRIADVGAEADVRTTTAALESLTGAQDPGYGPPIDPLKSPFKTTIGGGSLGFTARDPSHFETYGKPNIQEQVSKEMIEGRWKFGKQQSGFDIPLEPPPKVTPPTITTGKEEIDYPSPPSGYTRSSPFPKTDIPSKVISETPGVKEVSPFPEKRWVNPQGGLDPETLKLFEESSSYIPGLEGDKGVLSPLEQYTTQYIEQYKALQKASSGATTLKEAVDTGATAAEAVDVGEDVIGAAGKSAPGVGDAMTAYNVGSILFDQDMGSRERVSALAETGADVASSYAIASGNPLFMAAGLGYKLLT